MWQECFHFICCSVWWHHIPHRLFSWTFSFCIHGVEILFDQWEMHGEIKKGVCLSVTLHKDLFPLSANLDSGEWIPSCLSVICAGNIACPTARLASHLGLSAVDQGTVLPCLPSNTCVSLKREKRPQGLPKWFLSQNISCACILRLVCLFTIPFQVNTLPPHLNLRKDFHAFIKITLSPGDKTTGNFYFSVVYH